MNTSSGQIKRAPLRLASLGAALAATMGLGALSTTGCSGALSDAGMPTSSTGTSSTGGTTGTAGGGTPGGGGMTTTGGGGTTTTGTAGTTGLAVDPGTVVIHRLNALEYDNTVNDLLGLSQASAQKSFIPDEKGSNGFDNEADAFTMTDDELQQYYNSADALGEQVFASPTLVANIVTCKPAAATDATCLNTVINTFGARAYRRPLTTDEVTQFQTLAADAVTKGQDFNGSVKQIVKAMLMSMPFLYRIELDPVPTAFTVHKLSSYELASRLSYLMWSSMPDAALFKDAQSGALVNDATLTAQFTRMLADPKASNFVSSVAGQWFGGRDAGSHVVEATAFPAWTPAVRDAMVQEINLYFAEFVNGNLPWTQFMTAPMNFVNGPLAAFYGITSVPATQTTFTKVMNADPNRVGFMGLAGFLAQTSFSYRTVPTYRGKWVLVNLLGEYIPPPPTGIQPLDPAGAATDSMTQEENVRVRLAAHRTLASCGACHNLMDPIGLGMENFDGIGKYRTKYGNGQAIDASGMLPDGTTFSGIPQLAAIMSSGAKLDELKTYAVQQVLTYATSRPLSATSTDAPYLAQIGQQWAQQNYSMKALIQDVILSDPFRSRHGGI
jgi:Protein of unknown function (DUF1592)/Protein of unknown function (DUF1588)/Protein of unknown function (DUF1595)/Protein of unknown function (DUF1587)/Protein of unknown function (DUF1585)